jgi:hypothetical protein
MRFLWVLLLVPALVTADPFCTDGEYLGMDIWRDVSAGGDALVMLLNLSHTNVSHISISVPECVDIMQMQIFECAWPCSEAETACNESVIGGPSQRFCISPACVHREPLFPGDTVMALVGMLPKTAAHLAEANSTALFHAEGCHDCEVTHTVQCPIETVGSQLTSQLASVENCTEQDVSLALVVANDDWYMVDGVAYGAAPVSVVTNEISSFLRFDVEAVLAENSNVTGAQLVLKAYWTTTSLPVMVIEAEDSASAADSTGNVTRSLFNVSVVWNLTAVEAGEAYGSPDISQLINLWTSAHPNGTHMVFRISAQEGTLAGPFVLFHAKMLNTDDNTTWLNLTSECIVEESEVSPDAPEASPDAPAEEFSYALTIGGIVGGIAVVMGGILVIGLRQATPVPAGGAHYRRVSHWD